MPTNPTKGQIEDKIAKAATQFYLKTFGVGPRETRVYILSDIIIIRLKGKLLPLEQKLLESAQGISLVKDIRHLLYELTVKGTNKIIKNITGQTVVSSHSDVSTKTGEIFQAYIVDIDYERELTTNNPPNLR